MPFPGAFTPFTWVLPHFAFCGVVVLAVIVHSIGVQYVPWPHTSNLSKCFEQPLFRFPLTLELWPYYKGGNIIWKYPYSPNFSQIGPAVTELWQFCSRNHASLYKIQAKGWNISFSFSARKIMHFCTKKWHVQIKILIWPFSEAYLRVKLRPPDNHHLIGRVCLTSRYLILQ